MDVCRNFVEKDRQQGASCQKFIEACTTDKPAHTLHNVECIEDSRKIDRKSAFWKQVGQYRPNFYVEGDIPHYHYRTDS